jgi:glycosyltransferase involved in cell wall biosynthesis
MRQPEILIDGYNLALRHGTGVATYGRTLLTAANTLNFNVGILYGTNSLTDNQLLNEIAVFEARPITNRRRRWLPNWSQLTRSFSGSFGRIDVHELALSGRVIPPSGQFIQAQKTYVAQDIYPRAIGLFRQTGITSSISIPDLDVAHWTYPLPIEAKGAKNIYTLHDLVPLKLPYATADDKARYYSLCRWIMENSDHIVTVSESSKRDIIDLLGVSEDKVTNTYQPVDIDGFAQGDEKTRARRIEHLFGVGFQEYFIFFGAIEPKKNVARLLEAYLSSGTRTPLVVVGAPGWGSEADTSSIASLRALDRDGKIIWLTYLPRDLLILLISGAKATLFPSLYEGFGLPVVESLALGTPVMTSNTSSLPEVAGDAALLIDPYHVRSMADAIWQLDTDSNLRVDLKKKSSVKAAEFSPQRYAERISKLYGRLLDR